MEGHIVAGEYGPIEVGQEDFEIDSEGMYGKGITL